MSIEAIAEKIGGEAAEEAAAILRKAGAERDEALSAEKRRLEEEYARDLDRLARSVKDLEARQLYHIRREAGRMIENERRAMLDRAIRASVERLADLPDDRYLDLVRGILQRCTLEGRVEVLVSPRDEGRITADFLAAASTGGTRFVLSEKRHQATGGVIMRSGGVSLNATFSTVAALEHDSLVMDLASSPEPPAG